MTRDLAWLDRLNKDRKGIWSVLCPYGSSLETQEIAALSPREVENAVIRIVPDPKGLALRCDEQVLPMSDFPILVSNCAKEAAESGRSCLRVTIGDFHGASVREQCALDKRARSLQETHTVIPCQFVFCGRWGYYAFRTAYRSLYGKTNSPGAETKNVIRVPPRNPRDILRALAANGLMQSYPSELDIVAAQFVAEHTGGDEFLVDQAVSHLAGRRGDWTSNVEQVLEELTEAPDVIDAVRERIGFLDTQSRSELTKLLVFQRLVRPADRTESEHLWLAGIAQCLDLGSGKQCVCVASPLIETVLRRITQRDAPGTVALSEDLCFQHGSLAATAYRRLAEVETLLRNLVVTMWYAEAGDNWSQRLDEIKTLSREQEQSQEVRELVDLVREALAASGVPLEGMTGSPTPTDGTQEPRPKQSIRQSAESWRQRQTTHHGVELARDNLLQFLTTEALMSVLVNKKFGLHGPGKPFRLEYLVTALEEYIAIRSAVAHNQAVKISTISRLDDLHRRFVEWVTVFADSENQRTRSPPP